MTTATSALDFVALCITAGLGIGVFAAMLTR
jgi:hypothetical protein